MFNFRQILAAIGVALIAAFNVHAAPIYNTASFSGGIQFVSAAYAAALGIQPTNTCSGCNAGRVAGNVLFDTTAVPPGGTGAFLNVPLGPVSGASDDLIFEIEIGPWSLGFGDAGIEGGPLIQFNPTGKFNGFAFVDNFMANGTQFKLSIQGGIFTIFQENTTAASGYINIGDANLTNRQLFTPGGSGVIPEPASIALFGLGLLGLAALRRKSAKRIKLDQICCQNLIGEAKG